MKSKIILKSVLTSVALLSAVAPMANVVSADNISSNTSVVLNNDSTANTIANSELPEPEIVYLDEQGVEHPYNPNMRFSSSVVWIGIKFHYTSAADGRTLKAAFNSTYGVGAAGDAIAILAPGLVAGGPVGVAGAVVSQFVGIGLNAIRARCREGASLVDAHPNKGYITMFLDRCTWSAS